MKKVFLALAVASVFVACNNGGESETPKTDSPAATTPKVDSPAVAPKVDSPAVAPKVDSPVVKKDSAAKK
ncbi:hypothetical protein [Ferruginibacter sp.]